MVLAISGGARRSLFLYGKNPKIRMETGLIIENGLILPSKNEFENCHF
jgi:hypothetical protein